MKTLTLSIVFIFLSVSLYGKNNDLFLMAGGNLGLQSYYHDDVSYSSFNKGLLAGARYTKFELFFSWDVTDDFYSGDLDGGSMDATNYNLNLSFRLVDKKLFALSTGISAGVIQSHETVGSFVDPGLPGMESTEEHNTYYPVGILFDLDLKLMKNGTGIFALLRMPFNEPFWSFQGGVKLYFGIM